MTGFFYGQRLKKNVIVSIAVSAKPFYAARGLYCRYTRMSKEKRREQT
jgi:hypothetical protein